MARRAGLVFTLLAAAVVLVGCTPDGPAPAPTPTASSTPDATAPDPELQPSLSAEENLPFFDWINRAVVVANPEARGRDFIDALTAAGFDKMAMQVTSDTTTLGEPADSVQFSVLFQGECLVGQYGPKSEGYHSAVRAALGTGGCLVGATRPIDW